MENKHSSPSTLSSGYTPFSGSCTDVIEFEEQKGLENSSVIENPLKSDWNSQEALLVTKASSTAIGLFCIFKINESLRCEYYRTERKINEISLADRRSSRNICDQLQFNRQTGLLSGLNFYQDLLTSPQKSITVYTDLLRCNFGENIDQLLSRCDGAELKIQHHHQHDAHEIEWNNYDYNQFYQAISRLLSDDIIEFKNVLTFQLGKVEFYRVRC